MKKHIYTISFNLKGTREEIIQEAMKFYKHHLFCGSCVLVEGGGERVAVVNDDKKVGVRKLKRIEKSLEG